MPGGRILAPGLVNAHTHAGMSLLRGHSNDAPLAEWLEGTSGAFELRMTYDDIRAGLALALVEMIRCRTPSDSSTCTCGIAALLGLVVRVQKS